MSPDLMEKPSMLYYTGEDGIEREITGAFNFQLSEYQEQEYCDIVSSLSETPKSLSIKITKKQMHQWEKLIGLIKPIYKKKRKGKRFILYEVY